MKVLSLIIPITLIAATSAEIGLYYESRQGPIHCFQKANITGVMTSIFAGTKFMGEWALLKEAGIARVDALLLTSTFTSGPTICSTYKKWLPDNFDGVLWILIGGLDWPRDIESRLGYLEATTKACQDVGIRLGVHTRMSEWTDIFQSQTASTPYLTSSLLVSYASYGTPPNFDDWVYEHFGGWEKPHLKIFKEGGAQDECYGAHWPMETYFEGNQENRPISS